MKQLGKVLWGFVLIGIGLILGLNALDITNIDIFFSGWWTLFIIVPSFIGIFTENEKIGNLIGLLVGGALLLCCQGILDFNLIWKLALPIILVIIGLSIIFKDVFQSKINNEIKKINQSNNKENESYAIFSGKTLNFNDEEFKGTNLNAIFGGTKCDLRNATIKKDQVINCSAIFGGIDMLVPENVKVKVKSTSIFGGVSNKKPTVSKGKNVKTIYINAICMFGGVDIK